MVLKIANLNLKILPDLILVTPSSFKSTSFTDMQMVIIWQRLKLQEMCLNERSQNIAHKVKISKETRRFPTRFPQTMIPKIS